MYKKENIISCKEYVNIRKKELKNYIETLEKKPTLAVVQIDDNQASNSYIKGKKKDCTEVGINIFHYHYYSNSISQNDLRNIIMQLDCDNTVNGIIIQLPIPDKYNVKELLECISPVKDVDGFRADSLHKPCTPKGIHDWLKYNQYDLTGKNVTVIGRSEIVGKPMNEICIDDGATVTCCNSHTDRNTLVNHLRRSNLVVSAVGKPKFLGVHDFVNFITGNALDIVVDVGINRDENGKLCGDIDGENFEKYLSKTYLTPVPGGVGLLTRTRLLENTVEAYKEMGRLN